MAFITNSTDCICFSVIHITTKNIFLDKKKRVYYDDHDSIVFISNITSDLNFHKGLHALVGINNIRVNAKFS